MVRRIARWGDGEKRKSEGERSSVKKSGQRFKNLPKLIMLRRKKDRRQFRKGKKEAISVFKKG